MPLPAALPPIAWAALRLGALAAVAVYASRRQLSQPKDIEQDRVLDTMAEGVAAHPHRAEAERAVHGQGRFRRTLRLGPNGPALELDAAALMRLRVRRV